MTSLFKFENVKSKEKEDTFEKSIVTKSAGKEYPGTRIDNSAYVDTSGPIIFLERAD